MEKRRMGDLFLNAQRERQGKTLLARECEALQERKQPERPFLLRCEVAVGTVAVKQVKTREPLCIPAPLQSPETPISTAEYSHSEKCTQKDSLHQIVFFSIALR